MLNSDDKKIAAYVISSVAAVINGTKPPENDGLDWQKIISLAQKHSVLNILSYAVEKLTAKPDEQTVKYLREFRMQKTVVEAQQELAACDICEKLDEMQVRHMLLKGSVIKNYYPSPDMRTMGYIDILVDADRCDEVVKAFIEDGFEFAGKGDLHTNIRKGNAYVEFHRSMVDSFHTVLSEYYGDGFGRAEQCDGSFSYELTDGDFYVFLIAHIAKHYRHGGTGIRSLLDLYVYEKALPDLDFEYINKELEKIGLLEFCKKIRKIAFNWYSGDFDGKFDLMSEYIAAGGVYGIEGTEMQNSYIFDHIDEDIRFQKIKTLFRIVFLGYDELKIRYPFLEGKKFLLPLFWIIRFLTHFFTIRTMPYKGLTIQKRL